MNFLFFFFSSSFSFFLIHRSFFFFTVPTQCLFYKPLSDRDRAITYKATRKTLKCDRALAPSWYRFVGPAGNKMADSPPPVKRCSTHAPGWLKGKHPSEARRTVTRTVCYHWNGDACRWSSQVSVTNCGDYFVYHLVPTPQCYMRYCGTGLGRPSMCQEVGRTTLVKSWGIHCLCEWRRGGGGGGGEWFSHLKSVKA